MNVQYQRASCQEETEAESINESSAGFLPGSQDLCTLSNLLFPKNEEPSRLSGFTVNICTSVLGQTRVDANLKIINVFTLAAVSSSQCESPFPFLRPQVFWCVCSVSWQFRVDFRSGLLRFLPLWLLFVLSSPC